MTSNSVIDAAKTVFPSQTYFYCKHGRVEVPLKVIKSEMTPLNNADSLITITFTCSKCRREILYKISASVMKQFLPKEKPAGGKMKGAVV